MKIFGAIGRIGSGKDEVINYLKGKYGLPAISVGDIVREMAEDCGLEPSRENLERVASEARRKNGKTYFMKLVLDRVRRNQWQKAWVTGIRTPQDVRFLKGNPASDFILIHVYVDDPRIRYERLTRRNRADDPDAYDDFLEQDRREEKLFQIEAAATMADYALNNSGSLEDLHRQLDAQLKDQV